jgi:hypothetical protein
VLCVDRQAVFNVVVIDDGVDVAVEKVPAAHAVQTRFEVGVRAAE